MSALLKEVDVACLKLTGFHCDAPVVVYLTRRFYMSFYLYQLIKWSLVTHITGKVDYFEYIWYLSSINYLEEHQKNIQWDVMLDARSIAQPEMLILKITTNIIDVLKTRCPLFERGR